MKINKAAFNQKQVRPGGDDAVSPEKVEGVVEGLASQDPQKIANAITTLRNDPRVLKALPGEMKQALAQAADTGGGAAEGGV